MKTSPCYFAPTQAFGQVDRGHRVLAVGVGLGVGRDLVVHLPAADHDLHAVAQPGVHQRLDGVFHRVVGEGQEPA